MKDISHKEIGMVSGFGGEKLGLLEMFSPSPLTTVSYCYRDFKFCQ